MRNPLPLALVAVAVAGLALAGGAVRTAHAHCQVPCGIYDDAARIDSMKEDAATISKAVASLRDLAGKSDPQSMNQIVRWTNTKEEHASKIIDVVSTYFLTQKLKPVAAGGDGYDAYLQALADHHAVMRAAMKTKQTVDPEAVAALDESITRLATHW